MNEQDRWMPLLTWESKAFAEQDVKQLISEGKEARLSSTKKPIATEYGTIRGRRWYAEYLWPAGAVDFRGGKWLQYINPKSKSLDLSNLKEMSE